MREARQTSPLLLEARAEASEYIGRELTDAEWAEAYPPAAQKLEFIIEWYGDAEGARNAPQYLGKLVQEQLAATAMRACYSGSRAQKKTASEEDGLLTTTNTISPTTANVNTGRRH